MAVINNPPLQTSVDMISGGNALSVSQPWATFFSTAYNILAAVSQSGTTANRPTSFLYTGRTYFDTTLGLPIWYKIAGWVNATGAAV